MILHGNAVFRAGRYAFFATGTGSGHYHVNLTIGAHYRTGGTGPKTTGATRTQTFFNNSQLRQRHFTNRAGVYTHYFCYALGHWATTRGAKGQVNFAVYDCLGSWCATGKSALSALATGE